MGRIFLSHTSELAAHPAADPFVAAAKRAVERAGHVSVEMGTWTASPLGPAELCAQKVRTCQAYVGLFGFCYGTPVREDPTRSYTELEFDVAGELDLPRLAYTIADEPDVTLPRAFFVDDEYGPRQTAFRARVDDAGLTRAVVRSPQHLETLLYQALIELSPATVDAQPAPPRPVHWVPTLLGNEIERTEELAALTSAVLAAPGGTVGVTTAVVGAGGFGKTTLARLLVNRADVREHFRDGMVWVDLGHDLTGPDLAAAVTRTVERITGSRPATSDPFEAGVHLEQALGERRLLLVLDDAWYRTQLDPFLRGGPNTVRLVTTRQPGILPESATPPVPVDAMTAADGVHLLTRGLTGAPSQLLAQLLEATGAMALLLSLVNGQVRKRVSRGQPTADALGWALDRFRSAGPAALDLRDTGRRGDALDATLQASLDLLHPDEITRFRELAIFGEDVSVPLKVLTRYWAGTGGLGPAQVETLCDRLADSSLLAEYRLDPTGPRVRLHDVTRDWLRHQTGEQLPRWHRAFLEANRGAAPILDGVTAWWDLPESENYLWAWLPTHLHEAGLTDELTVLLHNPRFLVGKLERGGPAGVEADLALATDTASSALQRIIRQDAPVLGPLEPQGSLAATLLSRLGGDPAVPDVAAALEESLTAPYLRCVTPPPDLPHPALRRVLTSGDDELVAVAIAPDGTWLATAGGRGTLRIWDPVTGTELHTLIGHTSTPTAVAISPDGSWIASTNFDGTARIWEAATGTERLVLAGHDRTVSAVAIAPDGTWLVTTGYDGTARIWDAGTGVERHTLTQHAAVVNEVAISPDGSWLVTAGDSRTARVWDPLTGKEIRDLTHPGGMVTGLAVAPDGSWIATATREMGSHQPEVRIWEAATGAVRHALPGNPGSRTVLAVAPDGSWLATGGADRTIRLWDPLTGNERDHWAEHAAGVAAIAVAPTGSWLVAAGDDGLPRVAQATGDTRTQTLAGHTAGVRAVAVAPDGTWLVSVAADGTARVWEAGLPANAWTPPRGHGGVEEMASAPDGAWVATASRGATTRGACAWVWDPATARVRRPLRDPEPAHGVAVIVASPDGSWLATGGWDCLVRIWNPLRRKAPHVLSGHTGPVTAAAVAPDGSWLATTGGTLSDLMPDGTVRVWDPVSGTARHTLSGHPGAGTSLVASPDGSWLASTGVDKTIRIWDIATGVERHTLIGHTELVSAMVVAPDGSWLATSGLDAVTRLWDPVTGTERGRLDGRIPTVTALAVAPDRSWLATASRNVPPQLWDPGTGVQRCALIGQEGAVHALATSPDGAWLATAGSDGTVRIWRTDTGAALAALRTSDELTGLVRAGSYLVAGGALGAYFFELVGRT